MEEKRKSWLALLLGVLGLGLGQIYNRQPKKAAALIVFTIATGIAGIVTFRTFWGLIALLSVVLAVKLLSVVDGFLSARRIGSVSLAWYNRWYFYIIYIVLASEISSRYSTFAREHLMEAFKIPSSAMEPGLIVGDHFVAEKRAYTKSAPARGDIVIFTLPDDPDTDYNDSETQIIKRIIGLPGETVEVKGKTVLINGTELAEPYAIWTLGGKKDFPASEVPKGTVFLLGDNRDFSKDSRFWPDPFLPIERISAKALYLYWNSKLMWSRIGREVL